MSEERIHVYEGLFLFPQAMTANLQGAVDEIKELLKRSDAELLAMQKWDERRLAYEIKGHKRGVYFLAYFRVPATKLITLERDCNLSENLLRSMITRADHVTPEQIEACNRERELADEIRLRSEHAEKAAAAVRAPSPERANRQSFASNGETLRALERKVRGGADTGNRRPVP